MSSRGIRAGKAHILLSIRNEVRQGLRSAQRDLNRFAARTARFGAGLTAGAGALAAAFVPAVKQFAQTEQLLGRFDSVFGDLAQSSGAFADKLAADINASRLEIRDTLAQFQAIAQGQGFNPIQAEGISKELAKAAQDLVAFDDNIANTQQAVERLNAVFTGETEPLRRYGADFRKEALGVSKAADGLTLAQTQTLARIESFRTAAGRAGITGQALKEVDTLSARLRGLRAAFDETKSTIGGAIAPAITTLTAAFTDLLRQVQQFATDNPRAFQRLALAVPVVGALGAGLLGLAGALTAVGFAAGGLAAVGSILGGLAAPAAAIAGIGAAVGLLIVNFEDLRIATQQTFGGLIANLTELRAIALKTVDGIADAISAGKIELAGNIAALGLQISFRKAFDFILSSYEDMILSMAQQARRLVAVFADITPASVGDALTAPFDNVENFLRTQIESRQGTRDEVTQGLERGLKIMTDAANKLANATAAEDSSTPNQAQAAKQAGKEVARALATSSAFGGQINAATFKGPGERSLESLVALSDEGNRLLTDISERLERTPVLAWR